MGIACALFALAYAGSGSEGGTTPEGTASKPPATSASPEKPATTPASPTKPTSNSGEIVLNVSDCGDPEKENYTKVEHKLKQLMPQGKGVPYRDAVIKMRAKAFCMLNNPKQMYKFILPREYQELKKNDENATPLGFFNNKQTVAQFFSELADVLIESESEWSKKKLFQKNRDFKLYMAGVNAKGTVEEPQRLEKGEEVEVKFWNANNSPIEVLIEIPDFTPKLPRGEEWAEDDRKVELKNVEWNSDRTEQIFKLNKFVEKWEKFLYRNIHIQLLKRKYSETYHAGPFDRAFVYDAKTDQYTHKWN